VKVQVDMLHLRRSGQVVKRARGYRAAVLTRGPTSRSAIQLKCFASKRDGAPAPHLGCGDDWVAGIDALDGPVMTGLSARTQTRNRILIAVNEPNTTEAARAAVRRTMGR